MKKPLSKTILWSKIDKKFKAHYLHRFKYAESMNGISIFWLDLGDCALQFTYNSEGLVNILFHVETGNHSSTEVDINRNSNREWLEALIGLLIERQ